MSRGGGLERCACGHVAAGVQAGVADDRDGSPVSGLSTLWQVPPGIEPLGTFQTDEGSGGGGLDLLHTLDTTVCS